MKIDLTPTWTEIARLLLILLENGNEEGRDFARKEILWMGALLDEGRKG